MRSRPAPVSGGPVMTTDGKQVYEVHPLAEIFPPLEGPAFDALVADIMGRGLQEPIWLYENKILDGRNRYRACQDQDVNQRPETTKATIQLDLCLAPICIAAT